ncbi:hypothetical protein SMICM17S_05442 [Streptomyces microflavus]
MSWLPNQGPPALLQVTGDGSVRPWRVSSRPMRRPTPLQPNRNPSRIDRGTELSGGEQYGGGGEGGGCSDDG